MIETYFMLTTSHLKYSRNINVISWLIKRCANNDVLNRTRNSDLGPTFNTSKFDPYNDRWPRCIPRVCMEILEKKEPEDIIKTYFEVLNQPLSTNVYLSYNFRRVKKLSELKKLISIPEVVFIIWCFLLLQLHESSMGTCNCEFDKCSEFIFDTVSY